MLDQTSRVRESLDTHRHAPFARHTLRIPFEDYHALLMLFPALASLDPSEQSAAWDSFERSEFAAPYRVGKLHRGIILNGAISK